MTTYTAIANADIDAESPITVSLMTKYRDNPIAITEGASGAPKNVRAALSTTTHSISGSASGASSVSIAMNAYAFFPRIKGDSMYIRGFTAAATGTAADEPGFTFFNAATGSVSYAVDYRYIQA